MTVTTLILYPVSVTKRSVSFMQKTVTYWQLKTENQWGGGICLHVYANKMPIKREWLKKLAQHLWTAVKGQLSGGVRLSRHGGTLGWREGICLRACWRRRGCPFQPIRGGCRDHRGCGKAKMAALEDEGWGVQACSMRLFPLLRLLQAVWKQVEDSLGF